MVLTLERAGFIRRQPASPAASKCSSGQNTSPNYYEPSSIRHNHCAAVLVAAATVAGAVGLARHPVSCANPGRFDAPAIGEPFIIGRLPADGTYIQRPKPESAATCLSGSLGGNAERDGVMFSRGGFARALSEINIAGHRAGR